MAAVEGATIFPAAVYRFFQLCLKAKQYDSSQFDASFTTI